MAEVFVVMRLAPIDQVEIQHVEIGRQRSGDACPDCQADGDGRSRESPFKR